MNAIKLMIVDDHQIILDGLGMLIERFDGAETIGVARCGRDAIELARAARPDMVIMDISLPDMSGIDAVRAILAEQPDCKVIVLSMHAAKDLAVKALRAGARGYLIKESDFEEIKTAIRRVGEGRLYVSPEIGELLLEDFTSAKHRGDGAQKLTEREKDVLRGIADGKTAKEIGAVLSISSRTVEVHKRRIMIKLNLHGTAELTKYAVRAGLSTLGESI